MCARDSNDAARQQAKIENERAHFNQGVKRTEFHSKETRWQTRKDRITRGTSIERSDNYSQALYAKGIANQNLAELYKQKAQTSVGTSFKTGESVTSKKGFATYKAILDKQNAIERSIDNVFGRQWHAKEQRIQQHYQANTAKNRQALGVPGAAGFPVMMPPKAGDAGLKNLQMGLSIVGSVAPFFSDIRLKENIEEVGESGIGYKIYEWNYKSDTTTRYRGVIAQDVMKINPMAVGIRDNYLTVDYNKVDVDMEVVS